MNIRQLRAFCHVMETGSMSESARKLAVSQPAISKSIRLLEEALELRLFKRSGDRLYPSMEAQRLYPSAKRIFDEIQSTGDLAKRLRSSEMGTVKVAATYAIAASLLTEAIQSFHQVRPLVDLQMMALTPAEVIERVAARQLDVGFIHEPTQNYEIEQIPLCEIDIICALPKNHWLTEKEAIGPEDLINEKIISYSDGAYVGKILRQRSQELGVPWKVSIAINQTSVALSMASAGIGVAVVDSVALGKFNLDEVNVKPFRPRATMTLSSIFPSNRPYSPLCESFVDIVYRLIAKNAEMFAEYHRVHR
ncbi:LysR substrate-binding domain-containing protein [Ottowia caeni]|uniref:LysR family transcriptional regulator n=1 Tax=Ottowia caeni TaxID=2870339 RepID=UPI001E5CECB3|nr:LysR family transcriptional regulator [Ottowia caeni]